MRRDRSLGKFRGYDDWLSKSLCVIIIITVGDKNPVGKAMTIIDHLIHELKSRVTMCRDFATSSMCGGTGALESFAGMMFGCPNAYEL